MQGRRLPIEPGQDPTSVLEKPGDYCGPIVGWTADKPAVFFFLPLTEPVDGHPESVAMHAVCSPPHRFVEEPDGTLTIYDSIGAGPSGNYYWHGYLDCGLWCLARPTR